MIRSIYCHFAGMARSYNLKTPIPLAVCPHMASGGVEYRPLKLTTITLMKILITGANRGIGATLVEKKPPS